MSQNKALGIFHVKNQENPLWTEAAESSYLVQ